jgi:Zn finger protein HypA/HybF involved in hydrogenase expression
MPSDGHQSGWICTGCKKLITTQPFGQCADCGAEYRRATYDDLACDRCGANNGRRLLDRTGEFDRLCRICIDEVLFG